MTTVRMMKMNSMKSIRLGINLQKPTRNFKPCASAILLLLSASMAAAQTSTQGAKKAADYTELAKAPTKDAARHNPLETDPDAVAAGGKLFDLHCAECHGSMADGGKKGPSLRAAEVQRSTPGTIFWVLTNGVVRRGMPVWSKLPEPQRWQLVTYIKSLSSSSQPNPEGVKKTNP